MRTITLLDKDFSLFISADKIQTEVQNIADRINTDLKDEEVVFLGILNGAFMFVSDLVRKINFNIQISFVKLASYQGTTNTGIVRKLIGINEELKNKSVVVIEDIIDTGNTLESILKQIKSFRPHQIYVASMLVKPDFYKKDIKIDYIGFNIPGNFVVGYGLDYQGYGRNLRNLYMLKD